MGENTEIFGNFFLKLDLEGWSLCNSRCHHQTSKYLTHWGRGTHICVGNLTIIDPDNGLSPGRRQAIIWINAGILLIGPWGTNYSEILIGIQTFSFKKMNLKMASAKWRPFCLSLNVLTKYYYSVPNGTICRKKNKCVQPDLYKSYRIMCITMTS